MCTHARIEMLATEIYRVLLFSLLLFLLLLLSLLMVYAFFSLRNDT